MNSFKLKLIAPDGVKYEHEATEVTLPTPDGQVTILPNHMPLISLLAPGEIVVRFDNKDHYLATEGGVVEVGGNLVKVLADTAEDVNSLDELKIEEAKKAAEARMAEAKSDVDYADAAAQLEKEFARLKVLKRRKKYR